MLRQTLGLTQEQLAHRLGVSFATVNRWETGKRGPSPSSRRRLESLVTTVELAAGETERPDPRSARLIVAPTAFVGRDRELEELRTLVTSMRMVTLVGPGGCGKTRLVVELLRRFVSPSETVTVIALDEVADTEAMEAAVSIALGLRDAAGLSSRAQLLANLASTPRLLVVDNCEHLQAAVKGLLDAAMVSCPHLRVVATSRRLLDVVGEHVWPVPTHSLPSLGASHDEIECSEAVRLFVDRARLRLPGFGLNSHTINAVAAVCRQLDGLPLALELAAAWSAVLSPGDLARRLADGFALLDAPTVTDRRHSTLRAAVEWSDKLLGTEDRLVLARLSVFSGRFTAAQAEAVIDTAVAGPVLFALRHLVDSSWVIAEPAGEETTYAMLNILRSFGREILDRDDDGEEVRLRHAEVFADLAESAEEGLAGADQGHWRTLMERASGDIDAALNWAFSTDHLELGRRLTSSLRLWWYTTGRLVEGRRWVAIALRPPEPEPLVRARLLYVSAMLASENGDYATAAEHGENARTAFIAIGDHRGAARSSTVLGNVAKYRGHFAAARDHLARAVASHRQLGDDRGTAIALQNLASFIIDTGALGTGRQLMEESLALKRRVGDRRSVGYGLITLGEPASP